MSKFKKFYFMHIDKTLGSMVAPHLLDPLYNIMEENGIAAVKYNSSHTLHNMWQDFDEDTYIYTAIRDPFSRVLSDYTYSSNYELNGNRKYMGTLREWQSPYISFDGFVSWYDKYNDNNYQSKIISSNTLDSQVLRNNFNRINFKTTTDFVKGNGDFIRNKILSDLGISYKFNKYNYDHEVNFYSEFNFPIMNIINEKPDIIEKIRKNNFLDQALYEACAFNKEL